MAETYEIKCAACNVALQGPSADPKPNDMLTCPSCGVSDTFKNVMREVEQHVGDEAKKGFEAVFEEATRNNEFMTFKKDSSPKRRRRFIIDIKF